MSEPYSPLRYPGGKARLTPFIVKVLTANDMQQTHYLEPYAGGAGAALNLLFGEYVDRITINDADPRIRCMWKAITNQHERFIDRLMNTPVTVSEWRKQREIYTRCDLRRVLSVGFATFFLNRTTRSGIVHNGGPIGGYEQSGHYRIDARFNRDGLIRRISRIGAYSERIFVSGDDGLALLKKINRCRASARNSLVYLDPPYYEKGRELYMNNFTHEQHKQLADYLGGQRNFPWIMTYDNVEPIRKLYQKFHQAQFDLSYSAYKRRWGQELLIYPPHVCISKEAKEALPVATQAAA